MSYIFLNPDGSHEKSLQVVIEQPTGVLYAHQCAGYSTQIRVAEGFLIPLGGPEAAKPLMQWFWQTFHGNSYGPATTWETIHVAELKQLVSQVVCWSTHKNASDERGFLELEECRLSECTEGWVPVKTSYGSGILIFDNCD